MKHIGDKSAEWYSRGFAHGVLMALAVVALVVWFVCAGGAAGAAH